MTVFAFVRRLSMANKNTRDSQSKSGNSFSSLCCTYMYMKIGCTISSYCPLIRLAEECQRNGSTGVLVY